MDAPLAYLFPRWGAAHLGALGVLAAVALLLLVFGRRRQRLCAVALATALLLCPVAEVLWRAQSAAFPLYPDGLPLHFCSVMMPVAALAVGLRWRWAAAMTFFAVPLVCAQALITPALDATWPSPRYLFFFTSHGLLLLAALALPLLFDWRARRIDPLLCLLLGNTYLLLIHPVNLLLGTNYGFTVAPAPGSLLSHLGAAPWYFLWLEPPALLVAELMYLAVRPRCRRLRQRQALDLAWEGLELKERCIQSPKELIEEDGRILCRMSAELPMLRLSGQKLLEQQEGHTRAVLALQREGCFERQMPAEELTALRTGATAARSVKRLAREGWSTVALIGLGDVGTATLRCLAELFAERSVTLLLPDYKDTLARAEVPPAWRKRLLRPDDRPDVFIFCLPPGVVPQLSPEQIAPGCLALPVSYRGFAPLAPCFDSIYTDDIPQLRARAELKALALSGETVHARRRSAEERILCYNLGCAVQDIFLASHLM